jgi:3-deoxy-D-manno-octulosonate 8-phosphate phosphatase (KDO 8-P phosphatase)
MALAPEVAAKIRRVRLVILDVDGVLTDGRVLYTGGGTQGVFFCVQDGTGIKYLQRAGIRCALLTGRNSEAVLDRAETLGIEFVVQGAKIKLEGYETIIEQARLEDAEIAYVGDDLPDLPVMRRAGLAVAVPNAVPEILDAADLVMSRRGGDGAVRELAELLLNVQDKWEQIMERYT